MTGVDLPTATDSPDARWQPYQLRLLADEGKFSIDIKSRQIGWSWTVAAEALADAYLNPRHTAIFVSLNHDDAREKIRYAKQIHEALPKSWRRKLLTDSQTALELDNGSRLISHASTPPRGKRATVYLDELAHCALDREIYRAAVGMTTRGGRIRLGSTPLGRSGVFWEIATEALRPYPGYTRRFTPWWVIPELSTDPRTARSIAPDMETAERVARFGTDRLREISENLLEEDFRQEYELEFQDETTAWITWEEIKGCQDADGSLLCCQGRGAEAGLAAVENLVSALERDQVEKELYAGMDIGRRRDLTELVVLGSHAGKLFYRLGISLSDCPFDKQEEIVSTLMQRAPVTRLLVDRNGLGMHLAERLETRFAWRVRGMDFTNASKENWAVEARLAFQRGDLRIPQDRDLAYQIHAVRKSLSPGGHAVFDAERTAEHHADKFWALALAISAAKAPVPGFTRVREGFRI